MRKSSDSRKKEILQAAANLFQRRGYHATTMQEVANEVGILKGSLYHHFRSKQEILFEMTRGPLARLVEDVERIASTEETASEKIRRSLLTHVRAIAQSHPHLSALTAELDESLPEGIRERIMELRHAYQTVWLRMVTEGLDAGEIDRAYAATVLVNFILGAVNWMHRWYDPGGSLDSEELGSLLAKMVLEGITSPAVRGALSQDGASVP